MGQGEIMKEDLVDKVVEFVETLHEEVMAVSPDWNDEARTKLLDMLDRFWDIEHEIALLKSEQRSMEMRAEELMGAMPTMPCFDCGRMSMKARYISGSGTRVSADADAVTKTHFVTYICDNCRNSQEAPMTVKS